MRAVVLEEYGGPEVLTIKEIPDPVPGPEEVLVDVVSTALNRADVLQRMGLYPGPPAAFEVPGLEFAGVVAACGERVVEAREGDVVMGIVAGGAYAERLVTHERMLLAVPSTVPVADAAAIPEVFITAFDALVVQGGLTAGRVALIHAGGSGVGTAAIQIAANLGARVVVTASADKLDRCKELGAHLAIDRASEDFVAATLGFTLGRGVDVVLDVVGGDYAERNVELLAVGGTIVQVGVMGGARATINLGDLIRKRGRLLGTALRSRPLEEKIALSRRVSVELLDHFERALLRPVIDTRLPLDGIADAHRRMQSNVNVGKIVIDVMR